MTPKGQTCPTCGKQCHTKAEAKRHAASLRRKPVGGRNVSIYKCPDWKQHGDPFRLFHVGHSPSRRWRPGSFA